MKTFTIWMKFLLLGIMVDLCGISAYSQGNVAGDGTFVNLDFEASTLPPTPPQNGGSVPVAEALPGWSAYYDNRAITTVLYNDVAVGGAAISVLGPTVGPPEILQGKFTVYLQSGIFFVPVGVGQTGMIPMAANSIEFLSDIGGINVTFNGQSIPVGPLSPGVYGGSISQFSGKTGNLVFTLSNGENSLFDDVTFSTQMVPEPETFVLLGLGSWLIAVAQRRKRPAFR